MAAATISIRPITPRRISRSLPDKRNNVSKARLPDLAVLAAALPLEQRPPRVTEAAPGPGHPGTATALAGLDATYGSLGRHAEALPLQAQQITTTAENS